MAPKTGTTHDTSVGATFENVRKSYVGRTAEVEAVADFTLKVEPGSFVSLLGPSGCGKSTLLMIMAGLLPPSNGQVKIDDASVTGPQTNIGIVFQDATLLDWRSALENIMLQVTARGLDHATYHARAMDLLASVGLGGFQDKYPFELSGGMRQRVSLCRALVHDPPFLLMDEPFGALDALTREQLMLDLHRLWFETSKTVLFVTHSIAEAVFLSDRVVVMTPRPGRIARIVDIELPHPRSLDVQSSPECQSHEQEIFALFRDMGVLHD